MRFFLAPSVVAVLARNLAEIALMASIFKGFAPSQEKSHHYEFKTKPLHVVLLIICGYYMSKISLTKTVILEHDHEAVR